MQKSNMFLQNVCKIYKLISALTAIFMFEREYSKALSVALIHYVLESYKPQNIYLFFNETYHFKTIKNWHIKLESYHYKSMP